MAGALAVLFSWCLAAGVVGCRSTAPYEQETSWLIHDNSRPSYIAAYDVIYLSPRICSCGSEGQGVIRRQETESLAENFGRHVRIFAPIYHNIDEVDRAVTHYLLNNHGGHWPYRWCGGDRPFVFVAGGRGAELLAQYETENQDLLRKRGLVGGWYRPAETNLFVTPELVAEIESKVKDDLYQRNWGNGR